MEELNPGAGESILAIWNDCYVGDEDAYESWYQSKHLIECLRVPGFLRGRRFQRITGDSKYFTYYETESPEVLSTSDYLRLLNNPSSLTEQIMCGTFLYMSRTVCRVVRRFGQIYVAFAVTAKLEDDVLVKAMCDYSETLLNQSCVARAEIWAVDMHCSRTKTREETLRGEDEQIKACLIVETLRETSAREISEKVCERLGSKPKSIGCYQLLCDIQSKRNTVD